MANTTNFNWATPDDTDLVKDGAAAIRTLGSSIDTSFVDLKGGTTGQILSKASNTDLDYTWITNDVGDITNVAVTAPITGGGSSGSVTIGIDDGTTTQKGAVQLEDSTSSTSTTKAATPNSVKSAYDLANAAIPKSLVDAAGDLIYATADNTVARLGLGTAGKVLTVNSGATAPEWATPAASALTKISSTDFTTQSAVAIDSLFSSTYLRYMAIINVQGSTANALRMQMRYSATNEDGGTYFGSFWKIDRTNTTATAGYSSQTYATLLSALDNQPGLITIYFSQVGNTSDKAAFWFNGMSVADSQSACIGAGISNTNRTYTGINLIASTGTITGNVKVYGLAN